MRTFELDLQKYDDIEGNLVLKVPPYRERLRMIKECNFQMNEQGEVKIGVDSVDSIITLITIAEPYFESLHLKSGDVEVNSLAEAEEYAEFDAIITEAASAILNAGKLGK